MSSTTTEPVAPAHLAEYAEEAAFVWLQRASEVHAPHVDPQQCDDLDERLAANLDGLATAGEAGWEAAVEGLANCGAEDLFAPAVLALTHPKGDDRFDTVVARLKRSPESAAGIVSAFGWVAWHRVAGRVDALLVSEDPLRQHLGLAACGAHRHDPGDVLGTRLGAPVGGVRARAARAVGELGRLDLVPKLAELAGAGGPETGWWVARSRVLLGDRGEALEALEALGSVAGPRRLDALRLALLAAGPARGHALLHRLERTPESMRLRVLGAGLVGDPRYVPWLIDAMDDPALARIACEAFVHITGADVNLDVLEALPPEGYDDAPSDDPEDDDVALPEDVPLPWPDVPRVAAWWAERSSRLTPGARFFLGRPVTPEYCLHVLRSGLQLQRVLAAHHRTLIAPGTVLFPTSSPAWRQRRLLEGA